MKDAENNSKESLKAKITMILSPVMNVYTWPQLYH